MSNLLDKYTDNERNSEPDYIPAYNAELAALYTEHNELLKESIRLQRELLMLEEKRRKEEKKRKKAERSSGARRFFEKFCDAVCKAIPKVLTTLATLAFGYFVTQKAPPEKPKYA